MGEAYFEWKIDPVKEANKLTKGLKNRAMRYAMNKAAAVVKAAVTTNAPVKYGYLKRSIKIRVRNYKNSAIWVGVVGPKGDFRVVRRGRKATKKKAARKATPHRPALYARFLEKGTKHAKSKPFLLPALNATAARYLAVYHETLRQQIAAILSKKK